MNRFMMGKCVTIVFIIASLIFCSAIASVKAGTVWTTETIYSSANIGEQCTIDIGPNNVPQMSYYTGTEGNGSLMYAKLALDGTWEFETIASGENVGEYSSLAVDSNNVPHLSFYNNGLMYANKTGSAWMPQTVESGENVGEYSSIAVDSNNKPHISYFNGENGTIDAICYARFNGSEWMHQTLASGENIGVHSSIAVDANNNPHISYCNGATYDNCGLMYARWNGAEWNYKTVASGGSTGKFSSLRVNKNNTPIVGFYISTQIDSQPTHGVAVGFGKPNMDDINPFITALVTAGENVGGIPSLAVDSNDNLHLSDVNAFQVCYYYSNGASWQTESVDAKTTVQATETVDTGISATFTSIAVDSTGTPYISYCDYAQGILKISKREGPPPIPENPVFTGILAATLVAAAYYFKLRRDNHQPRNAIK